MPDQAPSRALIVDDDRAIAAVLTAFLARLGFATAAAHDYGEARERMEAEDLALLITDLQLSGLESNEGFALAREARRRHPRARIVLISGAAPVDIATQAPAHGIDLFLPKPISLAALADHLRELLPAMGDGHR